MNETTKPEATTAVAGRFKPFVMFLEKLRYWHWKNWYMANFPFKSPQRFMGYTRVTLVYDPAFKSGGMNLVKKIHAEHLDAIKKMTET